MEKLDKIGTGNAPLQPKNTKIVLADDYNKVIDKLSELIDEVKRLADIVDNL